MFKPQKTAEGPSATVATIITFVIACFTAFSVFAEEESTKPASKKDPLATLTAQIDELRIRHNQGVEAQKLASAPEFGDADFAKALEKWHAILKVRRDAGRRFTRALLEAVVAAPDEHPQQNAWRDELHKLHAMYATDDDNFHRTVLVWKLLTTLESPASESMSVAKAEFLATLVAPGKGVRTNDVLTNLGATTEPLGWENHATYALAHLRGDHVDKAKRELRLLRRKVARVAKASRGGNLDYGPEAGEYRHKTYVAYLQQCGLLDALVFIGEEGMPQARELLKTAIGRNRDEEFPKHLVPLFLEVKTLLK